MHGLNDVKSILKRFVTHCRLTDHHVITSLFLILVSVVEIELWTSWAQALPNVCIRSSSSWSSDTTTQHTRMLWSSAPDHSRLLLLWWFGSILSFFFFSPMGPPVLMNFVVFPPGCGDSVADFWGWGAHEAQLRCPDDVSGDMCEDEVPGWALKSKSTNYPDHGHHGDLPLPGKIPMVERESNPGPHD